MVKEHIDTTMSTVKIDGTTIDGISSGSLPFPKPSRGTKDVTTIADIVKKKGLQILDPGTASFSGFCIPGDVGQIALKAASSDMEEHTIRVTVPEAGTVFEYQAYVSTDYPTEEDENTLMFNCDLEVTGGFLETTTYAGITSIEGADAGIAYFPALANTALPTTADEVVFLEATGITTDTVEVTAVDASYIGITHDGGKSWTELTSGTGATFLATNWPAAGGLSTAKIMVMETDKATRFVTLLIARE